MPYKKKYHKYKKKYRKFKKAFRKQRVGGILTRTFKTTKLAQILRFETALFVDAVTAGISAYSFHMYDPAHVCFNAGGAGLIAGSYTLTTAVTDVNNSSTGANLWNMYGNLYDMYKPAGFKLTISSCVTSNIAVGVQDNTYVWNWYDVDNNQTTAINVTIAQTGPGTGQQYFMDYLTAKKFQLTQSKPYKRYIKCPKLTQSVSSAYSPLSVNQNGYMNTATGGYNGMTYVYWKQFGGAGAVLPVSTMWAMALVEYYVIFKQRV